MSLDAIPAGARVLIDANILIYAKRAVSKQSRKLVQWSQSSTFDIWSASAPQTPPIPAGSRSSARIASRPGPSTHSCHRNACRPTPPIANQSAASPLPPPRPASSPHVSCTSLPSFSPGMHLGSEPLRQFRYPSHKSPSILISPEHCFDAGRPAHDRTPTVRDMDAERSRHASRVCHHAHLSIVRDRPH